MPRAAAQLGARSLPSPQKQLPAPLAQGVGAAGRSSRPQLGSLGADYTATPRGRAVLSRAPPRPAPRGRDRLCSRVPTLVIMIRRPQQLFLPAPQGRPSGFPAERSAWASGARGRHRGHYARTPSPCPGMNLSEPDGPGCPRTPATGAQAEQGLLGPIPMSLCACLPPTPQPALAF